MRKSCFVFTLLIISPLSPASADGPLFLDPDTASLIATQRMAEQFAELFLEKKNNEIPEQHSLYGILNSDFNPNGRTATEEKKEISVMGDILHRIPPDLFPLKTPWMASLDPQNQFSYQLGKGVYHLKERLEELAGKTPEPPRSQSLFERLSEKVFLWFAWLKNEGNDIHQRPLSMLLHTHTSSGKKIFQEVRTGWDPYHQIALQTKGVSLPLSYPTPWLISLDPEGRFEALNKEGTLGLKLKLNQ